VHPIRTLKSSAVCPRTSASAPARKATSISAYIRFNFLSKPVRAAGLWAPIDRVVGAHPATEPSGPALLDPRVLWDVCGGDAGILDKIGQAFRARLPAHMAAVREALREQDSLHTEAFADFPQLHARPGDL
jgi:hypothetical protein